MGSLASKKLESTVPCIGGGGSILGGGMELNPCSVFCSAFVIAADIGYDIKGLFIG